ncbi:MAG: Phenylalanine--tRNA ligase beta subunit [Myxococcota bacterium]|nr:Phenylalanine--tRNA ligase beta subunit [Myxococcota bacterium]
MRVSLAWLSEFVEIEPSVDELAELLTTAGLEVEGIEDLTAGLDGIVVGEITAANPHPAAGKLKVCTINAGGREFTVVSGAPNARAGIKVPFIMAGGRLPGGGTVDEKEIRGVMSSGMLCSEKELGLGDDHSGLMELDGHVTAGETLADALGLRDFAIQLGVTPNRPDWLGHIGVAREIAALTGKSVRLRGVEVPETGPGIESLAALRVDDPDGCPWYTARVITGVRVGPSPGWLKRQLRAVGQRSVNNVVDVTNYILLKYGQPLHAFDLNRLEGGKVIVRRAQPGETITTLDNVERRLDSSDLLICNAVRPAAIAGVMGGADSAVDENTTAILLESAYFDPATVRKTARRLGLATEASLRFGRGADPDGARHALDRASALLLELTGGQAARGVLEAEGLRPAPPRIRLRWTRATALLGVNIEPGKGRAHLEQLGVRSCGSGGDSEEFQPPSWRLDLQSEVDLIEEIARMHGYHNIPESLPPLRVKPDNRYDLRALGELHSLRTIRAVMTRNGFSEAIGYAFVSPRLIADMRLDPAKTFPVKNPISADLSVMRPSIAPGLMAAVARNFHRGERNIRLFEIGHVYRPTLGRDPAHEPLQLAGMMCGEAIPRFWGEKPRAADFFDLKGVLEEVLEVLRAVRPAWKRVDYPSLHPGSACEVTLRDQWNPRTGESGLRIGRIGELHPGVVKAFDIPVPVYGFEINLDAIRDSAGSRPSFVAPSPYPAVERDIALVVDESTPSAEVYESIRKEAGDGGRYIEHISLFDVYAGEQVPEGKKSLAFNILFRSRDASLTDVEVNAIRDRIAEGLNRRFNAQLRE